MFTKLMLKRGRELAAHMVSGKDFTGAYDDWGVAWKNMFHRKSKVVLRALAHELGFDYFEVRSNKAGIAVSGEIYLYGYWADNDYQDGLFIEFDVPVFGLCRDPDGGLQFMWRTLSIDNKVPNKTVFRSRNTKHGGNQWTPYSALNDLEALKEMFLRVTTRPVF